ncbi:MAG: hypothetical protein HY778_08845 [Betaproteobacteria bacterium]|nr:hypothetical protein [Betaproteobacteria bacterium]
MEWEFSPQQVVRGEVGYDIAEFRRDLAQEVRTNLQASDPQQLTRSFNLLYDLCYAEATNKDFESYLAAYAFDPPTCEFLREMRPMMADNAAMLGAILQRHLMDRVESGMPLEDALDDVAREHGARVDGSMPGAAVN